MKQFVLIVVFSVFVTLLGKSQVQDTTSLNPVTKKKVYSGPRKAAILSAVIPGLGQAYNKKYWKIPIIYAGMGTLGYFFVKNQNDYNYYRNNLIAVNDNDPATLNQTTYNSDQLVTIKTTFRKRRDLSGFGLGLIYVLNIIDANIDAHLKTFDIGDNLSLKITPKTDIIAHDYNGTLHCGISVKILFR